MKKLWHLTAGSCQILQESDTREAVCTVETGFWQCSHNEGGWHWRNQCAVGGCLSEATSATERSLELRNLPIF